jgi:thymidylate synthase ThyX
MIKAEIVCDSLAPSGVRITTFVLTYPRFIHSEFMTHRVFSRNASSSRAIPVKKSIQMVIDNPAIPLAFTKNKKGMQGGAVLTGLEEALAKAAWLDGRDKMVEFAQKLADLEVHKQYANRILEPWSHITVVCTATDFDNFFALRCHEAAQPEIHALADLMYEAYQSNMPKNVDVGYWHLPFISEEDIKECCAVTKVRCLKDSLFSMKLAIKRSVAKCARVSYLNHDGTRTTLEQDLDLYKRLLGNIPIHASPAEHQACAQSSSLVRSGNFHGWVQYRKTLDNENVTHFEKK